MVHKDPQVSIAFSFILSSLRGEWRWHQRASEILQSDHKAPIFASIDPPPGLPNVAREDARQKEKNHPRPLEKNEADNGYQCSKNELVRIFGG